MDAINSYEDVQRYIQQAKQETVSTETNIVGENNQILEQENDIDLIKEIEGNKKDVKELCELLESKEMKSVIDNWKKDGLELHEMLKEAIKDEMRDALIWWNNHSDDEKRAVLMLSVQTLLDDGMETGETYLLSDVFPDIVYLSEHPNVVMKFIGNICTNPRYCDNELFSIENFKESFEKEVGSSSALFCINALLDARVCIASKLCINILVITNQIDC